MQDDGFDRDVVKEVLAQAALRGWRDVSLADAARDTGLEIGRVRARFPSKTVVLLRFGTHADQAALAGIATQGTPRERLFDMIMNRIEALQAHRAGVMSLFVALRTDPATALMLYGATLRSMKWLLEAAEIPATGVSGGLRVHGLAALWLYTLRAWERDESVDLAATMAAVDRGLDRAMQAERNLPGYQPDIVPEPLMTAPPAAAVDEAVIAGETGLI